MVLLKQLSSNSDRILFSGEKMINFENFLPIYSEIRKSKDMGQLEDLLEGLKVYDKNENGTMMAAELAHVLLSLGKNLLNSNLDN